MSGSEKPPRPKFAHRLEHLAVTAGRAAFGALSLDRAGAVGGALARFIGVRSPLMKRAEANLAFAMPELDAAARRAALAGMFDNFARTAIEYPRLSQLVAEPERIEVDGLEHLRAAKYAGRGAVIVTGHYGSWEPIRIAGGRIDWTPAIIYRAFNTRRIDEDAAAMMGVLGAPVFRKGRRGALSMLRHVRAGGAALILVDQRVSGAPALPFFDHPAPTVLAAAEIAGRYGAALIPARGERLGRSSRFRVTFESPITVTDEADAARAMTQVNARLEAWAQERPDHYFWLHHRWGRGVVREASAARAKRLSSGP